MNEIKFTDANPEEIIDTLKGLIEEELGRKLTAADPLYLFIRALSAIIIQQRLIIDQTGKMNLLTYATGDYLDHLGVLVGCERLGSKRSNVTMELTLSSARTTVTIMPAGTRFTAGDSVYFALTEDVHIGIGERIGVGKAECLLSGAIGNGYAIGTITEIVDPQPYLQTARNITESNGGSDIENDESYRERIRQAPEKYSNAGSRGAYEYHVKEASSLISDVCVTSPSPGVVQIYPLLIGGELPTDEILEIVSEKVNDREIRPLTDQVIVSIPEVIRYDIDLTYYISRSKITSAKTIQSAVESAIETYVSWQRAKLGRDVEPLELSYLLRSAGVKRVELNSPTFIATHENQVAIVENINVIFGGIEEE